MSIDPSILMYQMMQPPQARTDAELAGHMMRMAAIWPQMMESISTGKDIREMDLMRRQGYEPGSEAAAQEWTRRRPGRPPLAYETFLSGADFATQFPEQYNSVVSQIAPIAEPRLQEATPEIRDRVMQSLMGLVKAGRFPVKHMPDGTIVVDAVRANQVMADMIPILIRQLETTPQTETFGSYLQRKNAPLYAIMKNNPVLMGAHGGLPVDVRNPERTMGIFMADLRNHANAALQGAELAVRAMQEDPSPAAFARAVTAVQGIQEMVNQRLIEPAAAQGLMAVAEAWKAQGRSVQMPDGTKTYMPALRAQQYQNERTAYYANQAKIIATARTMDPKNPANQQAWDTLLANATKEGIDAGTMLSASRGTIQLDREIAMQRLAVERAQAAHLFAQARQLDISTGIQDQINKAYTKFGAVNGDVSKMTTAERFLLTRGQLPGGFSQISIPQYDALQKEFSQHYNQKRLQFVGAQNAKQSQAYLDDFVGLFNQDWGQNAEMMYSPARGLVVASTRQNLDIFRSDVLPALFKARQQGWIGDDRVRYTLKSYRDAIFWATKTPGVFERPEDGVAFLKSLSDATTRLNQKAVTPPSFWDWIFPMITGRDYRTGQLIGAP